MTQDEYADHLADIACQLAARMRDSDPADNQRWLRNVLPDPADQFALCFVLAAGIPDDRPWRSLTAWTVTRERWLQPHGTHAAAARHRYHGEDLCEDCRNAERERDRDRKRAARAAA